MPDAHNQMLPIQYSNSRNYNINKFHTLSESEVLPTIERMNERNEKKNKKNEIL